VLPGFPQNIREDEERNRKRKSLVLSGQKLSLSKKLLILLKKTRG